MKKLFLVSLVACSMLTSAFAERWRVQDFINSGISSIQVSNTIPVTNILSAFSYTTNTVGIIYTNSLIQNTTAAGDVTAFFHDVNTSAGVDSGRSHTNALGTARIVATIVSGSIGSSESCIFTFSQVPDGDNEATTAAERFGFGVVGVNGSTTTVSTNVPSWVLDATKVRVVSVVSTSTNAAIKVKSLRFVDWVQ